MIDVSAFVKALNRKPVAVFGLGISNLSAIRALTHAGAAVAAWDDRDHARLAGAEAGAILKDLAQENMAAYACLVLAPGVPKTHPVPRKAQEAGIEILCDIEILHRCGHGRRVIGITGTNGKSTTTALIGYILNANGMAASVGGNIGRAVLDLGLPAADGAFVIEVSSYQLDLCPTFSPDTGVLLNLTPDHIDRHGSMEAYAAAKMNLFRGAGQAVIAVDDEWTKRMAADLKKAGQRTVATVLAADDAWMKEGRAFDISGIPSLQGAHNRQNAAAAYAAARLAGLTPDRIYAAMKSFPGLPHRQFLVRTINGVSYVNDSKATNAAATAWALACRRNIYWIAGGKPKDGGLDGLEGYMERVTHGFLIGEAMDEFAAWLERRGVAHSFCETMDRAVMEAHAMAQRDRTGGTVLLSPACASFDQFDNFEHRGAVFSALVNDLGDGEGAA